MARVHPEIAGLVDWQPLARGGFSTVWQARQESLDRLVAVKVDHRTLEDEKEQRRFLREAGAAGRLSGHPGIVTVHYAGILPDDRPYLVMDLCPGGSLTRWLKPENRQNEQRILDVGVRIADALAAAHARGVLHRDVKPANILIDSYDLPGLADFGLAALPEPGIELSVTLEGMTPAYAPKEVFYLKPPTEFGDVYSLAATLYALFEGKPPHWPDSGTASVPELLELQKRPILRLPHVNDQFMDVLLGALADEPEDRPTAAEFRDQLAALDLLASPAPASSVARSGAPDDAAGPLPAEGADAEVETDSDAAGEEADRQHRRRTIAVVLVAAVLAVGLAMALFANLGPSPGAGAPTHPTTSVSQGAPSTALPATPSPTPSTTPTPPVKKPAVPAGFIDCSAELGENSYCISDPECWGGTISVSDLPALGTMQDCKEDHAYQTFAAGQLSYYPRRQSQLEADKTVQKLCSAKTLNKMLPHGRVLKDWEIKKLAPQINLKDNFYRCLFGNGLRHSPVKFKKPS